MAGNRRAAAEAAAADGVDLTAMGLGGLFVEGTATYKAVQMLLAHGDEPVRSKDIVDATGVTRTSIPRVINTLGDHGVRIERHIDRATKEASYRCLSLPPQPTGDSVLLDPRQPTPIRLLKVESDGGRLKVTLDTPLGEVTAYTEEFVPAMATPGELYLKAVSLYAGGAMTWVIGTSAEDVHASGVAW